MAEKKKRKKHHEVDAGGARTMYQKSRGETVIFSLEPTHGGLWRVAQRKGNTVIRTRAYPLNRAKRIYESLK
ncbi:MAG TPA: hypothetical protein VF420_13235 [Casimicrobiaceae bacterium]